MRYCAVCGAELDREAIPALPPLAERIVLDAESLSLARGESRTLVPAVLPEGAERPELCWSSSDERVATVDANGTVTAMGGGEAVIRCASADGALAAECPVAVPRSFFERLLGLFRG